MAAAALDMPAWLLYSSSAVFYTAIAFSGEFSKRRRIFSARNARTPSSVLTKHALFLVLLLSSIYAGLIIYPSLPAWLRHEVRTARHITMPLFAFVLMLLFIAVGLFENSWLYVDVRLARRRARKSDAAKLNLH